jgi:hypothetical protein
MRVTARTIWALWAIPVVMVVITYSRLAPADLYHVSHRGLAGGLGRALVYVNFPIALVAAALVAVTYDSITWRWKKPLAAASLVLCATVAFGAIDQTNLDARPINALPAIGVALALLLTLPCRWPGVRLTWPRGAAALGVGVLAVPWIAAQAGFFLRIGAFDNSILVHETGEPGLVPLVHLGDHHGLSAALLIVTALALWFAPRGAPRTTGRRATQAYLALMLSYGIVNLLQDLWGEQIFDRGWSHWSIPDAVEPGVTLVWAIIVLATLALYWLPRRSAGDR